MRSAAAVLFATLSLIPIPAAADPSVASPGDCAQPLGEFVTPPVYSQSAGVAGSVSDHFAPTATAGDVLRVLPLELTRKTLSTTVQGTTATAIGLVGATAETAGDIVRESTDSIGSTAVKTIETLTDTTSTAITSTTSSLDSAALGSGGGVITDAGSAIGEATSGVGTVGTSAVTNTTNTVNTLTNRITNTVTGLGGRP